MKGAKEFVIGFSFSLASVLLGGQLYSNISPQNTSLNYRDFTKINLFKAPSENPHITQSLDIFANIDHQSFTDKKNEQILQTSSAVDYPEDDEILSVNIDSIIPIEYNQDNLTSKQAEVLHFEDAEISATLPIVPASQITSINESPWEVAKAGKYIKNKQLLQTLEAKNKKHALSENLLPPLHAEDENSYRVAEKIKSSLLFPIPDEILSDENLTPTFIKKNNSKKDAVKTPAQKTESPASSPKDLKILTVKDTSSPPVKDESKSFLNSLSSWFSPSETEKKVSKVKKTPSYSSQEKTTNTSFQPAKVTNSEFINFYKTLQETSTAHENNSIVPSELKLFFQPDRAEISGQTLRWLKAFSETTKDEDTYLEVRLDVSASTELQKKRLNLLYTIFMNNGVDFKKIDTVFTSTEPNAFIIRTLKMR